MKKFIYILNILLLLLIPTTVFVCGDENVIHYSADTSIKVEMIKTTVLLNRSNKKREEEEAIKALALKQEEEEKAKQEQEKSVVRQVAVTVPQKVVEEVGSLAGSDDTINNDKNIGNNTTVTINPSDKVYVGSKLKGSMSAYGRDCCSSDPNKQGHTASGYNIKLSGMYYNDAEYGRVRILAADKNFKLYSIIKVNDPLDGEYKAIILDRGDSNIGIAEDRLYIFDLVVESQEWARRNYGVHKNVEFEILRIGQ